MVSKGANTFGGSATWRQDGRELWYIAPPPYTVMSVEVSTSPAFKPGQLKELFKLPPTITAISAARDGSRFLAGMPIASSGSGYEQVPFTVVLNWQRALKP